MNSSKQKYIALIDCDSFFVSCERKLNPELNGLPISVVSGERGCVISRSREAKLLGVPMGIPLFQAVEKFPECIYVSVNHHVYAKISRSVMNILKSFSPNAEVYSVDEAFVDFTGLVKLYKMNYYKLAKYLQKKIMDETGIPVSIGISRTKTLAKLASDKAKNRANHICIAGKSKIPYLLEHTEIQEVWGIGRKLGVKLRGLGVKSAADYVKKDDNWIKTRFGKNGMAIKAELLGIITSPINTEVEIPKSISDTKSFPEFSSDLQYLKNELMVHIHEVCSRLRKINCKCSSLGVILKTKDFQTLYLKAETEQPADFEFEISKYAFPLLESMYQTGVLYRSTGIVLENFNSAAEEQLDLFSDTKKRERQENLGRSLDNLEKKFGRNIVRTGFVNKHVPFKQGFLTKPREEN